MPPSTRKQAALLNRMGRGDHAALEEFVRNWEAPLYHFLLRLTGCAETADDVRQKTLVRAFERAAQFRGGNASVWLYRIAYRTALNHRRESSRHRLASLDEVPAKADESSNPVRLLSHRERHRQLQSALTSLDATDRGVVWLRAVEGLSFAEIGAILQRPATSLRYRFLQSLQKLRNQLQDHGPQDEQHAL